MTKKDWNDIYIRMTIMEETVQRLPKLSQTRLTIEYEIKRIKELISEYIDDNTKIT